MPIEKLGAPPTVHGREIATVVQTSDGGIAVVIHPRVWERPQSWGIPIADFVRNVALMYAEGDPELEQRVLKEVRAILDAELDAPTSEVLPAQETDCEFELAVAEDSPHTYFNVGVRKDGSLTLDVGGEYGGTMDADSAVELARAIMQLAETD